MNERQRDIGTERRGGFTIVELLIVVGLIVLLLSILAVALRAATTTAQRAGTQSLMTSIKTGLIQFKSDIGYVPPVLDRHRDLMPMPDPDGAAYATQLQDVFSWTTLAEYVIGYGHHAQDGYGAIPAALPIGPAWTDETPATGIRHPGSDGVWGATIPCADPLGAGDGSLVARMRCLSGNADSGRVYGPYIELTDERLLASTNRAVDADGNLVVYFPGEAAYSENGPKIICDYWGRPLRFYRRASVPGNLGQYDRRSFLSDVFVLRPWDVQGDAVDGLPDGANDTTASYELKTAEFAIHSAGPDRAINTRYRIDDPVVQESDPVTTDLVNQDNLIEVGP